MKIGRLLLAGVLAGVVVFIWSALSHMVLGLGEAAVKSLPNESAVLTALNQNVKAPGFYLYPGGMEAIQNAPKDQQEALTKQYEEVYKAQPHGILVLTPPNGVVYSFPKLLLNELLSNILGGVIAAWLLSLALGALPSFLGRIGFVAALGLFAALAVDFSYWNWYGFPTKYLLTSLLDNTLGWALAGVALALFLKPRA
ncbi:MAG: hypothetical protein HYR56_09815 [Acidobacteria bacterium]|nr:hypothetical protein [Acidobacteriota bacterium]MBI3425040.1 hypothetical protein [Acidobacteriota bacterium]